MISLHNKIERDFREWLTKNGEAGAAFWEQGRYTGENEETVRKWRNAVRMESKKTSNSMYQKPSSSGGLRKGNQKN